MQCHRCCLFAVVRECLFTGACSIIDYVREDGTQSPFPLIRCENIFVLPGVPGLLQAKWKVQFGLPAMSVVCTIA